MKTLSFAFLLVCTLSFSLPALAAVPLPSPAPAGASACAVMPHATQAFRPALIGKKGFGSCQATACESGYDLVSARCVLVPLIKFSLKAQSLEEGQSYTLNINASRAISNPDGLDVSISAPTEAGLSSQSVHFNAGDKSQSVSGVIQSGASQVSPLIFAFGSSSAYRSGDQLVLPVYAIGKPQMTLSFDKESYQAGVDQNATLTVSLSKPLSASRAIKLSLSVSGLNGLIQGSPSKLDVNFPKNQTSTNLSIALSGQIPDQSNQASAAIGATSETLKRVTISSPISLSVFIPQGPFTPKSITGLQVWLKADQGLYKDVNMTQPATQDGDVVRAWKNLATSSITYARASNYADTTPTLVASGINGMPAVNMPGGTMKDNAGHSEASADGYFAFVGGPTNPANGLEAFLVIKDENETYGSVWLGQDDGTNFIYAPNGNGSNSGVMANGPYSTMYVGSPAHQWMTIDASFAIDNTTALYVNDMSAVTGYTGTPIFTGLGRYAETMPRHWGWGKVAEVILYNRPLTSEERAQVRSYLNARYGI